MSSLVDDVVLVLTGHPAPTKLAARTADISDPKALRSAILSDPVLFSTIPTFRLAYEIDEIRKARASGSIKLVIGAAGTSFPGWVATNEGLLNLLKPGAWGVWLEENSVEAMLSEHVWEHLSETEGETAARTCFAFLAPGMRLRIAVPDGFHPSAEYRDLCRVGGRDEHQMFYTYNTLMPVLERAGFRVEPLEYWDEQGHFHCHEWSTRDGHIGRCAKLDHRNKDGVLTYTSLIVDAFKPSPKNVEKSIMIR